MMAFHIIQIMVKYILMKKLIKKTYRTIFKKILQLIMKIVVVNIIIIEVVTFYIFTSTNVLLILNNN